jgi:hypothetical protein
MKDLVPIVMFTGLFAMIFGIVYLRTKENMAMLEKGFNPKEGKTVIAPFVSLKFALLLIGSGLGLLTAYFLDVNILSSNPHAGDTSPLYPSLIGIGGGLGLLICYFIEKKHWAGRA